MSYFTTVNDQFSGSSLDSTVWNTYGYTSGISEGGGKLNLLTSSTLDQVTEIYLRDKRSTDNTPLTSYTNNSSVIAETKVTLSAQRSYTSGGVAYSIFFGIWDGDNGSNRVFEFQAYTSSGIGTSTVYTLIVWALNSSDAYINTTITTFSYNTVLYLRISINSSGVPTLQYSTNGTSWTTAAAPSGYAPLVSTCSAETYLGVQPFETIGPQQYSTVDYFTYQTTDPPLSYSGGMLLFM